MHSGSLGYRNPALVFLLVAFFLQAPFAHSSTVQYPSSTATDVSSANDRVKRSFSSLRHQRRDVANRDEDRRRTSAVEASPRIAGGSDVTTPRIVGGTEATSSTFPYFILWGGCGATLIHNDIALSAAHCSRREYAEINPKTRFDSSSTATRVVQVKNHPRYDPDTYDYDFAILKLKGWFQTEQVRLNGDDDRPRVGERLEIVGFGGQSSTLKQGRVDSISSSECARKWLFAGYRIDEAATLCAESDEGVHPCTGDSGGPLLSSSNVQMGVISSGSDCDGLLPAVYSRVSKAKDWIEDQICKFSDFPPEYCFDWFERIDRENLLVGMEIVRIDVYLDDYPEDIRWRITSTMGDDQTIEIASGGDFEIPNSLESRFVSLRSGAYYDFTIEDVSGFVDGLGTSGSYSVATVNKEGNDKKILVSGRGDFGQSESTSFLIGNIPKDTQSPTTAPRIFVSFPQPVSEGPNFDLEVSTSTPTLKPTTIAPTPSPIVDPTAPPVMPSPMPSTTVVPSNRPTEERASPTESPISSSNPTPNPTEQPIIEPTESPVMDPTINPTETPTKGTTNEPTGDPTRDPTRVPTRDPTRVPTRDPTRDPTRNPTSRPTTASPTYRPTPSPTTRPTDEPTRTVTLSPTAEPTYPPTPQPTEEPTANPTTVPAPDPSEEDEPDESSSQSVIYDDGDFGDDGGFLRRSLQMLNEAAASNQPISAPSTISPTQIQNEPAAADWPSTSPSALLPLSPTNMPTNSPTISLIPTISASPTVSPMPSGSPSSQGPTSLAPTSTKEPTSSVATQTPVEIVSTTPVLPAPLFPAWIIVPRTPNPTPAPIVIPTVIDDTTSALREPVADVPSGHPTPFLNGWIINPRTPNPTQAPIAVSTEIDDTTAAPGEYATTVPPLEFPTERPVISFPDSTTSSPVEFQPVAIFEEPTGSPVAIATTEPSEFPTKLTAAIEGDNQTDNGSTPLNTNSPTNNSTEGKFDLPVNGNPSNDSTDSPSISSVMDNSPYNPADDPSISLTSIHPSVNPTQVLSDNPTNIAIPATERPTTAPSENSTEMPSASPETKSPTGQPTDAPIRNDTNDPSASPTTKISTGVPTHALSGSPTNDRSSSPTTKRPTENPSEVPSENPSTSLATESPTGKPIDVPSDSPTFNPSPSPITNIPTENPTQGSLDNPSISPTMNVASDNPTEKPSASPTARSPVGLNTTNAPTASPSDAKSELPTNVPMTEQPSLLPTNVPMTEQPSLPPTGVPTTEQPTVLPTGVPTTGKPSPSPTSSPTDAPTIPIRYYMFFVNVTISKEPEEVSWRIVDSLSRKQRFGYPAGNYKEATTSVLFSNLESGDWTFQLTRESVAAEARVEIGNLNIDSAKIESLGVVTFLPNSTATTVNTTFVLI